MLALFTTLRYKRPFSGTPLCICTGKHNQVFTLFHCVILESKPAYAKGITYSNNHLPSLLRC